MLMMLICGQDERHLDLRCWMALASRLMADIGKLLGRVHL
jgi:hypothetical protein